MKKGRKGGVYLCCLTGCVPRCGFHKTMHAQHDLTVTMRRKYHCAMGLLLQVFVMTSLMLNAHAAETNDSPSFLEHARRPKSAYRDSMMMKYAMAKMQFNSSSAIEPNHPHIIDKVNSLQYRKAADVMNEVRFRNRNTVKHSVKHMLKHKMKIGACSCDFLSGVTATKIVGSTGNCAPKVALCGFCMNAAWAAYWHPDEDTCHQYMMGARDVCDSIAGGASAAASDIGFLYEKYGPQFGASAVWCREMGCCAVEA